MIAAASARSAGIRDLDIRRAAADEARAPPALDRLRLVGAPIRPVIRERRAEHAKTKHLRRLRACQRPARSSVRSTRGASFASVRALQCVGDLNREQSANGIVLELAHQPRQRRAARRGERHRGRESSRRRRNAVAIAASALRTVVARVVPPQRSTSTSSRAGIRRSYSASSAQPPRRTCAPHATLAKRSSVRARSGFPARSARTVSECRCRSARRHRPRERRRISAPFGRRSSRLTARRMRRLQSQQERDLLLVERPVSQSLVEAPRAGVFAMAGRVDVGQRRRRANALPAHRASRRRRRDRASRRES